MPPFLIYVLFGFIFSMLRNKSQNTTKDLFFVIFYYVRFMSSV